MVHTIAQDDLAETHRRSVDTLHRWADQIADLIEADEKIDQTALDVLLAQVSREVLTAINLSGRILATTIPANHDERLAYYKRDPNWVRLMNEQHQIKSWLLQWNKVEHLVREIAARKRHKLYPAPPKFEKTLRSQLTIYDEVFDNLRSVLNPHKQDAEAKEQGSFPDVPLPHSVFMAHIHAAYRVLLAQGKDPSEAKFIDVGCGAGMKVITAAKYFRYCYGLELDPGYAQAARDLFEAAGEEDCGVIEGNALHFDSYDVFDVIYAYRPISDNDLMVELERTICARAAQQTLLVAPYPMFVSRAKEHGCAQIAEKLFLIGGSKKAAQRLRRKAEMIGPYTSSYMPALDGAWDRIIAVSQARGYTMSPRFSTEY